MEIKIIDITNALNISSVETVECMNVQIVIGEQKFTISSDDKSISISVNNILMIEPSANNRIYLTEER